MRLAVPLVPALLSAALIAGCGGSDDGAGNSAAQAVPEAKGSAPAGATAHECDGGAGAKMKLRATGVPCSAAIDLAKAWKREQSCPPAAGASRSACGIAGGYRCLGVVTDRGVSVSCARPDRSIAFTVKPG